MPISIDEHPLLLAPVHMKQVTKVAQMQTHIFSLHGNRIKYEYLWEIVLHCGNYLNENGSFIDLYHSLIVKIMLTSST